MRAKLGILAILPAVCLWALPISADVIWTETFSGSTLPATLTYAYSGGDPMVGWSIDGSNRLFEDAVVPSGGANATAITTAGFIAPAGYRSVYSLDVGIPVEAGGGGGYNIGMRFGGYDIVFHPGYPGGAFRISGVQDTNQNMGFSPRLGVLHHVKAEVSDLGGALWVDVWVTGLDANLADSSLHTYVYSFVDTTPNLGTGTFGARRSGGVAAPADAFFDNFQFETQLIPEPSVTVLLGSGLLGLLLLWRRNKRCGR